MRRQLVQRDAPGGLGLGFVGFARLGQRHSQLGVQMSAVGVQIRGSTIGRQGQLERLRLARATMHFQADIPLQLRQRRQMGIEPRRLVNRGREPMKSGRRRMLLPKIPFEHRQAL